LLPIEVAAGPMATELVPVAVESGRVELAWKYLMPAPFASALRLLTELLVVDRPVESELTPLCAVLIPLDAEVEREETLLFVVESPLDADVERDPT